IQPNTRRAVRAGGSTGTRLLFHSGGEAAGDVVVEVGGKEIIHTVAYWADSDLVAGDFADADEVTVGRGNENFLGGIKFLGAQGLLDDGDPSFGRDLHEDAARNAFETSRVTPRCEDLAPFPRKNLGGSASGGPAAPVEHDELDE